MSDAAGKQIPMKYSIAGREFDLRPLDLTDRERVRELALRMVIRRDELPFRDVVAGVPTPADLAAEASELFIRAAGFSFTDLTPQFNTEVWRVVLTAAGFERLPDGRFNMLGGTGIC
jgi:hypothetical protein